MRSSIWTDVTFLLAVPPIGCNRPTAPAVTPASDATTTKPDWRLVTLQIDGFKKSKSGGTRMS